MVAWWFAVAAASTAVLMLVNRLARRLLPLAMLLNLSLVFPDHAPSRFAVAARAGTVRSLEQLADRTRQAGRHCEPAEAAELVLTLLAALNVHDRCTRGHSERVRAFTDLLADELRLPQEDRDKLRWAALLHDIGKLHVSTKLLNKPGKPTEEEWAHLQSHPIEGAKLVAPLASWLGSWADVVVEHHERWDGAGYPNGLFGEQISLGGRIVSVADAYEVMTAPRPYRRPVSAQAARRGAGRMRRHPLRPHRGAGLPQCLAGPAPGSDRPGLVAGPAALPGFSAEARGGGRLGRADRAHGRRHGHGRRRLRHQLRPGRQRRLRERDPSSCRPGHPQRRPVRRSGTRLPAPVAGGLAIACPCVHLAAGCGPSDRIALAGAIACPRRTAGPNGPQPAGSPAPTRLDLPTSLTPAPGPAPSPASATTLVQTMKAGLQSQPVERSHNLISHLDDYL